MSRCVTIAQSFGFLGLLFIEKRMFYQRKLVRETFLQPPSSRYFLSGFPFERQVRLKLHLVPNDSLASVPWMVIQHE